MLILFSFQVNVKVQLESEHNSHIKIYRSLAALRQQPSILHGSFDTMVANGTVFAYREVQLDLTPEI